MQLYLNAVIKDRDVVALDLVNNTLIYTQKI